MLADVRERLISQALQFSGINRLSQQVGWKAARNAGLPAATIRMPETRPRIQGNNSAQTGRSLDKHLYRSGSGFGSYFW